MSLEARIQSIKDKLIDGQDYFTHVMDQIDESQWDTQVYSDGAAWNVKQLLIHLGLAEKGMLAQAQRIVAGQDGVPEDFDIERYNTRSVEKRADMTVAEARAAVDAAHEASIAWAESIANEAILDLEGRHGSMQILSVEKILLVIGDHKHDHMKDIAATLNIG